MHSLSLSLTDPADDQQPGGRGQHGQRIDVLRQQQQQQGLDSCRGTDPACARCSHCLCRRPRKTVRSAPHSLRKKHSHKHTHTLTHTHNTRTLTTHPHITHTHHTQLHTHTHTHTRFCPPCSTSDTQQRQQPRLPQVAEDAQLEQARGRHLRGPQRARRCACCRAPEPSCRQLSPQAHPLVIVIVIISIISIISYTVSGVKARPARRAGRGRPLARRSKAPSTSCCKTPAAAAQSVDGSHCTRRRNLLL